MAEFKDRLNQALAAQNIKPAELAKLTGIGEGAISQYRKGAYKASQRNLEKISEALSVSIPWLMGISEEETASRSIVRAPNLLPPPETYRVPRLGAIACGTPILAEQNIETYDQVPVSVRCDFTLLCRGDSMVGAGIEDGDVVYIREQPVVENGEIAAVMVGEEEATLKRFKQVGDAILLVPENNNYEPMVFTGGEMSGVRILGKAVGFTRYFEK